MEPRFNEHESFVVLRDTAFYLVRSQIHDRRFLLDTTVFTHDDDNQS